MENFFQLHFGMKHVAKTQVIKKYTRPFARRLSIADDDNHTVILVTYGTYIYKRNSANSFFQKQSFSSHKGRHLVKPIMQVTTSGYIVDTYGRNFADLKKNGANILTRILESNSQNIREWLNINDVMIVDRCFRGCFGPLQEMDYEKCLDYF